MCPNIGECWEAREATFLILGDRCTRRCGFCDVMTARPDPVDEDEPARIASAVQQMGLRFVVLTGVARDDLPDGGARVWAATIRAVREAVPGCGVEVLPTDFKGGERDIATVIEAGPDVFAHNLETIRRLHGRIRPAFGYDRSLEVLRIAKRLRSGQITKSNLILGMGETTSRGRRGAGRPARCGLRSGDDGPVPAADEAPPAGGSLGHARRVRRAQARGRGHGHPARGSRATRSKLVPRRHAVPAGERCAGRRPLGGGFAAAVRSHETPCRPGEPRASGRTEVVEEEPACKPDPVRPPRGGPATISLGARAPPAPFAGAVRPTRELGRAVLERSLLGLAPGGACRAGAVARARW